MIKVLGTNHINSYRTSFRGDSISNDTKNSKTQPSEKFKSEKKQIYTYAYSIAAIAAIAAVSFGTMRSLQKQLDEITKNVTNMTKIMQKMSGFANAAKEAGVNILS